MNYKFKVGDIIIQKKNDYFPTCSNCKLRVTKVFSTCLEAKVVKLPSPHPSICNKRRLCIVDKLDSELSYEHCLYYKMKVRKNDD